MEQLTVKNKNRKIRNRIREQGTDTDISHRSFTLIRHLFLGGDRSYNDVKALIFPSAENQQGFTVVS